MVSDLQLADQASQLFIDWLVAELARERPEASGDEVLEACLLDPGYRAALDLYGQLLQLRTAAEEVWSLIQGGT